MKMDIKVAVRQQRELGSKQWGVYVNGELAEGGFFSRSVAEDHADRIYEGYGPMREPQCDSQYSTY
jgi:hypothetical protein